MCGRIEGKQECGCRRSLMLWGGLENARGKSQVAMGGENLQLGHKEGSHPARLNVPPLVRAISFLMESTACRVGHGS